MEAEADAPKHIELTTFTEHSLHHLFVWTALSAPEYSHLLFVRVSSLINPLLFQMLIVAHLAGKMEFLELI